jgi:hypothetical protein
MLGNVTIYETDISTRVPSFPGAYGYIAGPFKKGSCEEVTLVTSDAQFLKRYTPDEKVEVGHDLSHFSALAFLQKSDKLQVRRVASGSLYGGVVLFEKDGAANDHVGAGMVDPTGELEGSSEYTFASGAAVLLYGANQGAWNNDISVKIYNYATSPDTVKEPNAFAILVYKDGRQVEPTWICSRREDHVDGYGRNIFVETLLEQSEYIRGLNNDDLSATTNPYPKESTTAVAMEKGDDGGVVGSGELIVALDELGEATPVTLLMDGGQTFSAYHLALLAKAEERRDCFAVLSVPYAAAAAADYMDDIQTYRQDTLAAVSSSWGGLWTPDLYMYDKFNNRSIYIPPDGHIAGLISQNAARSELWYAAGFAGNKAQILVQGLRRYLTKAEGDTLSNIGVNCIMFAPGRGIRPMSQMTLLSRPSDLDRVNVRLMLVVVEPAISVALEDFLYEYNDEDTRARVAAVIGAYMLGIKARKGVADFQVNCNTDNNSANDIANHILNVDLLVKAMMTAEFITCNVVITPQTMSFSVAEEMIRG